MNIVKIPDPVAYATPDLSRLFGENEMRTLESMGGSREKQRTIFSVDLVTTTQAEAYALTKVREALEEAAQACEARIGQHASGMTPEDVEDCDEEARECAAAIRALIPK